MQFKNIKSKVLVVLLLLVIIIAGLSFSIKGFGAISLSSLSTAKQLISSNSQDKISKLDDEQKKNLIEKIDREIIEIGIELNTLNREIAEAKNQLSGQQSLYSSNTAQINTLIAQTQSLQNQLNQQQNQLKNKNEQCAKLSANRRQNCKHQAGEISSRISATRSELNQKQATLNNLRSETGKISFQSLQTTINEKQKKITELGQVLSDLSELRVDVVDSNSNEDEPNQPKPGCTDVTATNWDSTATEDDGSCKYEDLNGRGCKDPNAINYDSTALIDDRSLCKYAEVCVSDTSLGEAGNQVIREAFINKLQEASNLVSKYTPLYDESGNFVMIHPEVSKTDATRMSELLYDLRYTLDNDMCIHSSEEKELASLLKERLAKIVWHIYNKEPFN